jgi:hypothetical protein
MKILPIALSVEENFVNLPQTVLVFQAFMMEAMIVLVKKKKQIKNNFFHKIK